MNEILNHQPEQLPENDLNLEIQSAESLANFLKNLNHSNEQIPSIAQEKTETEYTEPSIEVESTPAETLSFDTAESLAERQEKLKKGIKIVIGGPPHSGKSVFNDALFKNLTGDTTYAFGAAPDGEGPWYHKNYNDPSVRRLRQKGKFTPEYVADRKEKIKNWEGPLMLIDIGGIPSKENAEIIEGATHAIILAGSSDGRYRKGDEKTIDKSPHGAYLEMAKWNQFFEENNLPVIARLHSNYSGVGDHILENGGDTLTGSVHYLERGEPAVDRETIKQLAGIITGLTEGNTFYESDKGKYPFRVSISDFLKDTPQETVERQIRDQNGETKTVKSTSYLRSAIPEIYKKAPEHQDEPVWLDGRASAWMAIALSLAFEDVGSPDVRLNGTDGYVQIKSLPVSKEADSKWWDEPKYEGELNGQPVYTINNTAHVATNLIRPEDLDKMTIPELPENAIVIISSQGPNWLKASIASGYKEKVSAIAAFQPHDGATISWAKNKDTLGGIIKTGEVLSYEAPEIPLSNYLEDANRNLMNMSRTAHGAVDTSASSTKAEALNISSGEEAANLAKNGFDRAIETVYDARKTEFATPNELRSFVENIAATVNGGILKDGILIRSGEDSDKYPYVRIVNLPEAMDHFYQDFYTKLQNPNTDPVELAAFAEYNIDLTGHFFADGCGKTAKAISSFILMRANHKLPDYSRGENTDHKVNRAEYYAHAPKQIPGINLATDQAAYENFVNYYRTLF